MSSLSLRPLCFWKTFFLASVYKKKKRSGTHKWYFIIIIHMHLHMQAVKPRSDDKTTKPQDMLANQKWEKGTLAGMVHRQQQRCSARGNHTCGMAMMLSSLLHWKKMPSDASLSLSQCSGRADVHLFQHIHTHTKSPARNAKTSTISLMSVIYLLLLQRYRTKGWAELF